MSRVQINTDNAPAAIGPYAQAVKAGNTIYVSGQLPINPRTGQFPSEDIKEQTRQSIENIGAVLESDGYSYKDVVKTTVLLSDIGYFSDMNEVYAEYFDTDSPARVAFAVKDLPKGALVEIECVAYHE